MTDTTQTQTVDSKIQALEPGGSVVISQSNGITVTAERTGNGKLVKFVRSTANSSEVFHTEKF